MVRYGSARSDYNLIIDLNRDTTVPAIDLGTVGASGLNRSQIGHVGNNGNSQDVYTFTVPSSVSASGTVQLSGMSQNLNLRVYSSSGELIAFSNRSGTAVDSVTLSNLISGTYSIKVAQVGSNRSAYALRVNLDQEVISVTRRDQTLATNLVRTIQGSMGRSGQVHEIWYQFDVTQRTRNLPRSIDIQLYELSENIGMELRSGSTTSSSIVASSRSYQSNSGGENRRIQMSNLPQGRYWLRLTAAEGFSTYDLHLNLSGRTSANPRW